MAEHGPSEDAARCFRCEGEGYTYAVYGQLDTYEECELCGGTGVGRRLRLTTESSSPDREGADRGRNEDV